MFARIDHCRPALTNTCPPLSRKLLHSPMLPSTACPATVVCRPAATGRHRITTQKIPNKRNKNGKGISLSRKTSRAIWLQTTDITTHRASWWIQDPTARNFEARWIFVMAKVVTIVERVIVIVSTVRFFYRRVCPRDDGCDRLSTSS